MVKTKSKIKSSNKNGQNLKEKALEALKEVVDPEIGANIVDLGLIYDLKIDGNKVKVLMTLTSIGCPLAGFLIEEVESKLKEAGFENVEINLTFDPPWTPERMSKELRKRLGI
jgi:metal-sulfur cluster biosynthetic enzyme